MPEPEPNKKWDALLRAYAKKHRREVELHPVSRRALQDEVAKTFGQPERARKRSLFSNWWVRLPLATIFAAFAVLLIVQNRRFEESKGSGDVPAVLDLAKAPVPARPTISISGALAQRSNEFDGGEVASDMVSARIPVPSNQNIVAFGSAAPMAGQEIAVNRDVRAGTMMKALAPAGRAQPSAYQSQLSVRAQFQNNLSRQAVLRSFNVVRQGDNILVTDNDGSVYSGRVETGPDQSPIGYTFAVSGRNQSSQQNVVFRGRVEPLSSQALNDNNNAQANGAITRNFSQNQLNQAQSQAEPPQFQPSRVRGTAVVGGTNRIDVDAVLSR